MMDGGCRGGLSVSNQRKLKRTVLPKFSGRVLLHVAKRRQKNLAWALANVEEVQTKLLVEFCRHATHSEFGQKYRLGEVRNFSDYRDRVPVGDYDSFVPAFDRMRKGETNVLIPELVKYWGNSSGSSAGGRSKFLPICERQIGWQKKASLDVLFRFLANTGYAEFTCGFSMGLFPPAKLKPEGPVFVTSNPGLMMYKMPRPARLLHVPQGPITLIEKYEEKLERIADHYLDFDVRSVAGTTCWFSLLFDKLLAEARKRGRDVKTIGEIWPNLKVLLGGGVSATPYLPVIRDRVGYDIYLADSYNATEGGIFATTDAPGVAGMLMLPDRGVFFEFIPLEDESSDSPRRVPLWEVERDRKYAIVVTTPSGLFSYKLGDIVQFPSVDPLRIEFAGRLSGNLSTTQELTTHIEIEKSVHHAMAQVPCTTVDFTAGAVVGINGSSKSQYVFFVEFIQPPADFAAFERAVDEKLCELNRVYREHRGDSVAILPARVVPLPNGSVKRFMADIGNTSVQTKFPRIVNDARRDILFAYTAADSTADSQHAQS